MLFWFRKIIREEKNKKEKKENIGVDSCGDDNNGGLFLLSLCNYELPSSVSQTANKCQRI